MLLGASEELAVGGESGATHGPGGSGAEAPAHTWIGGVVLGLSTRDGDRTGAVHPFPEDDCYGIDLCL